MADSPSTGNEDHACGSKSRRVLRVMSGAARKIERGEPGFAGRGTDGILKSRRRECGNMQIRSGATDLNILLARNFLEALEDAGSDPLDFFLIQIAQLHGKSYAARNHIACAGLHFHPADGPDLPSRLAPH